MFFSCDCPQEYTKCFFSDSVPTENICYSKLIPKLLLLILAHFSRDLSLLIFSRPISVMSDSVTHNKQIHHC